jgi:hypothetical protein
MGVSLARARRIDRKLWPAFLAGVVAMLACGPSGPSIATDAGASDGGLDAGAATDAGDLAAPPRSASVIKRISLGMAQGDPTSPQSLDFTLPLETVSAFILAVPTDTSAPPLKMNLGRLTGSAGVLYDSDTGRGPLALDSFGSGAINLLLPNSPVLPFGPSEYQVSFVTTPAVLLDVTLLTKQAPIPLTTGTLDVNLWFATTPLNADQAPSDPDFQAMLDGVRAAWAQVGLTLGKVQYFDVADAATYRNLTLARLPDLCRSTASVSNDNLNWFFVDGLTGPDGSTLLGAASGVPGSPARGLGTSGIAVGVAGWPRSAMHLPATLVHETGHALGLFHTTESDGLAFDPIPDTPECHASDYDKNQDGLVDATECAQADAPNLMFWTTDHAAGAQVRLTKQQQFVMLRHPSVR